MAAVVESVAQACLDAGHQGVNAMLVMWAFGIDTLFKDIAAELGRSVDETTLEPVTLSYYHYAKTLTLRDFIEASAVINTVSRNTGRFFTDYDVLITPTLSRLPQDIGYYSQKRNMSFREFFVLCDDSMAYLPLFNMSRLPAISLPLGMSQSNLPIGVQFGAKLGAESTLIRLAAQLEKIMPWHDRTPAVFVN